MIRYAFQMHLISCGNRLERDRTGCKQSWSLVMTFSVHSPKLSQDQDITQARGSPHCVMPTHGGGSASSPKRKALKREKIPFCCYPSFYSLGLNSLKLLFPPSAPRCELLKRHHPSPRLSMSQQWFPRWRVNAHL